MRAMSHRHSHPAPVAEYVIAYAYPTSASALKHNAGSAGCFTLETNSSSSAYRTLACAMQAASLTGLPPGRWSIDHSLNRPYMAAAWPNEARALA